MSTVQAPASKWLARLETKPGAKLRLLCFPYAGAGSVAFRPWINFLPEEVELCSVQLPGREIRWNEAPFTDMPGLIAALSYGLRDCLTEKPYAFFGHSMGALVGFELVRELRRQYLPQPVHFFASGRAAPQLKINSANYLLPEGAFIEKIESLEGMLPGILDNPEIMPALLPLLRADFKLCETYLYETDEPLDCPITVFGGNSDPMVNEPALDAWQHQTRQPFEKHMFKGGHFFIHTFVKELLTIISRSLAV